MGDYGNPCTSSQFALSPQSKISLITFVMQSMIILQKEEEKMGNISVILQMLYAALGFLGRMR